jgi:hypothetical protein
MFKRSLAAWLAGACAASTLLAGFVLDGTAAGATPLANSSSPKEVVIDPTTGAVLSVTPLSRAQYLALEVASGELPLTVGVTPDISIDNVCDAGWACYYTNEPPYPDYGFYGSSGTYHGSWPDRSGFDTGDYSAYACWVGSCSGTYGPNTYVGFTSDVTGTAIWIN